jgi:hypothetical protein
MLNSTDPLDTKLPEAIARAQHYADMTSIPQTVYRNEESAGWWHTHSFANLLKSAELHVTFLPYYYFNS